MRVGSYIILQEVIYYLTEGLYTIDALGVVEQLVCLITADMLTIGWYFILKGVGYAYNKMVYHLARGLQCR